MKKIVRLMLVGMLMFPFALQTTPAHADDSGSEETVKHKKGKGHIKGHKRVKGRKSHHKIKRPKQEHTEPTAEHTRD